MLKFTSSGNDVGWHLSRVWGLLILLALTLTGFTVKAQDPPYTVRLSGFNTTSANLDQARNGGADSRVSPVDWVNGNAGASNAHYIEGYSIPYRVIMNNLPTADQIRAAGGTDGKVHVILEYDIRASDKHALDYLTHYQRLEPHTQFTNADPAHLAEFVNPIYDPSTGVALFSGAAAVPTVLAIPEPPTPGANPLTMPRASFNGLPGSERLMSLWGGTLTDISYGPAADLTAKTSSQRIYVSFVPTGGTASLAFGGHIASRLDWGFNNSASQISGSPYHMNLVDWNLSNLGAQDRSLSTSAVVVFPPCEVSGPEWICTNESGPFIYSADVSSMPGVVFSYQWSLFDNTAGASIVAGTATQREAYVNPGTTGGTFRIKVVITDVDTGVSSICFLHNETGEDSEAGSLAVQVIAVSISTVATNVSCYGDNDGTLAVTGSGYTSIQLFKDGVAVGSPVATTGAYTFLNLGPGSYKVRAFSGELSCNKDSDPKTITEPLQPVIRLEAQNVTCNGSKDGKLIASGENFTQLKLFKGLTLLSTVATSSSPYVFTGLEPGDYSVEASSAGNNGKTCKASSSVVTLSEPFKVTVGITGKDVTCYAGSDGSITATGANYSVLKLYKDAALFATVSTSDSPYTFSGLAPGDYKVVASATGYEGAECSAESGVKTLRQPAQITVNISGTDITCFGVNDGSIKVTGTNYSVLKLYKDGALFATVSTSSSPYTFPGLAPADYKVVASASGYEGAECSAESGVKTLRQPAQITVNISGTDITCFGVSDGSIKVMGTNYSVLKLYKDGALFATVSTSSSPYTFPGLAPADYKVVASASGYEGAECSAESGVKTLRQPAQITVNISGTDITCFGVSDGSIKVTGTNYSVLKLYKDGTLFATASTSASPYTFPGLAPADYKVVASASGYEGAECSAESGVKTLRQPAQITVNISGTDITCFGVSDGSIKVTGTNYSVLKLYKDGALFTTVSTSSSPYTFPGLAPADYKVVASASGYEGAECSAESGVKTLRQPAQVLVNISGTDISCYGKNDGTITVSGLNYTTLKLYKDGALFSTVITGDSPYSFTGLTPATYKVAASAAGYEGAVCSAWSDEQILREPSRIIVNATGQDISCYGAMDGSITVTGSGYTKLDLFNETEFIQSISTSSNPTTFRGLGKGLYRVEASAPGTNGNTCNNASSSVNIEEPTLLSCSIQAPAFSRPVCGVHQSNTLSANVTGGNGSNTYVWSVVASDPADAAAWSIYSGQGTTSIIFSAGRSSATFTLTVGDGNGCSSQCTMVVSGCASEFYCTYTQGFYGTAGGKACSPLGAQVTPMQMMTYVLGSGASVNFGNGSKYFQLFGTDITNGSIYTMLSGGKSPAALKGFATYSKVSTWPNVPIDAKGPNAGKISNILLTQAMTLYFNIGQNSSFNLANLKITGQYLITAKATDCGKLTAMPYSDKYVVIPVSVINYMNTVYSGSGGSTVANLLRLANQLLGGGTAGAVTLSDATMAIDAINRAFDGCRIFIQFTNMQPTSIAARGGYTPEFAGSIDLAGMTEPEIQTKQDVPAIRASAFPNPFSDKAMIEFEAAENTRAVVEVLSVNGSRVASLFEGDVEAGRTYRFEFSDPKGSSALYLYRIVTPVGSSVGRLIYTPQQGK